MARMGLLYFAVLTFWPDGVSFLVEEACAATWAWRTADSSALTPSVSLLEVTPASNGGKPLLS
jgi:hypothetical protein